MTTAVVDSVLLFPTVVISCESTTDTLAYLRARCHVLDGARQKVDTSERGLTRLNKSRTMFLSHPDLFIGNNYLNSCDPFKILGVVFDSKFAFERHICSIFHWLLIRLVYLENLLEPLGIRMSYWDVSILYSSLFGVLFPYLISAADSHLKLLDKSLSLYILNSYLTSSLSTISPLAHCVCFTKLFKTLCILSILNFSTYFIPGESWEVL